LPPWCASGPFTKDFEYALPQPVLHPSSLMAVFMVTQ
jgi:hypothetical protein